MFADIGYIQKQLDKIGEVLPDLLSRASMTELLGLNVSTFGLYSAIYGEIRTRLYERAYAEDAIREKLKRQGYVIEKRTKFIESEVGDETGRMG